MWGSLFSRDEVVVLSQFFAAVNVGGGEDVSKSRVIAEEYLLALLCQYSLLSHQWDEDVERHLRIYQVVWPGSCQVLEGSSGDSMNQVPAMQGQLFGGLVRPAW